MQTVTFELQSNIANRMNKFIQLFGSKEVMFDKFIEYYIKKLKREIALMQIDLNKYEQKYNMLSSKFYKQFENGQLGDNKDFILWSGIYEMQLSCKQKLQKLI
ncbi:MAG: hypothetical protein A2275_12595 [Bacteroidetes bacterium RIFOXYA12_FULL_35_11]|nr:MAG: hypothetical protein A2X01_12405 [Bacteroidetes bacterium GWF2_35_48]OFY79229.1 MAG: hypothetical protein A2275_12595 [Bacteroidetes bacterium RIFOXYA12_FULL_35_11]OFY96416.1 MAG: hypothetical protein A2309_12365 [Bacteroidetes bacterium RIFOXYB2_FULL_35_7]HBX51099.1 hypothetical protein [Bacteroidales bacterium]